MKKHLSLYYYLAIWAVVVGLFNALLFIIDKNHTTTFWVTYGFVMGSFVMNLVGFMIAPRNKQRINTVTTFCFMYAVVCLLSGIIFFIFPKVPVAVIICVYLVFTAAFVILLVFGMMNQTQIKENPQKQQEVFDMSQLVTYLQDIQKLSTNVAVRNGINDLVNFAMGATTNIKELPEVEEVEKQIFEYASFIKKNVEHDEVNNVFYNIDRVKKLLKEREAKLR